jgi:hypothetical protein
MPPKLLVVTGFGLLLGAADFLHSGRSARVRTPAVDEPGGALHRADTQPSLPVQTTEASPAPALAGPREVMTAPAPAAPTETVLMATLRGLGASDPARSLELARDGNRRFPNGADAAERNWIICKSLAALGRSAEAEDEAREMVQRYPGTAWANDVRRHLLPTKNRLEP